MERVFLSYTYNPAPDYQAQTELLVHHIRVVADTLGLQVLDGMDVGGRIIDQEIQNRIACCQALVAVETPWTDPNLNQPVAPPYVQAEYAHAVARGLSAIRVIHEDLAVQGMHQGNEYIPYEPAAEVDTLLKLMRTLALWKSQSGAPRQIEIAPADLGERFVADDPGYACQYRLLLDYQPTDWRDAQIWNEPGATFAYLPSVPEESKIKLRIVLGGERWESAFSNLLGRVQLARSGQ